jgi:phage-related protein
MRQHEPPRKTPLVFYRTETGNEIVRDWLRGLEQADRNAIGQDLMRAQFRWPIGMPLCRPLGDGLWEVRSNLTSNRIARVLFCFIEGRLLALHGFVKKTQKTPDAELEIARKRMSEFKQQKKSKAPKRSKKKEAP